MRKILNIVLIVLAFLGGAGLVVSYILQPNNTLAFLESVKSWLNQPLPIVGVTTTAVLFFAWNIFKESKYGKNTTLTYEQKFKEALNNHNEKMALIEQLLNNQDKKIDLSETSLKSAIITICNLSTNQKLKNFGKELENGEEKDITTTIN